MRLRRRLETLEAEAESPPPAPIDRQMARLMALSGAAAQRWMKVFFNRRHPRNMSTLDSRTPESNDHIMRMA